MTSPTSVGNGGAKVVKPLVRTRLADELAERIAQLIRSGTFGPGDRLPSIARMAKQYRVGHPTLREALKKLESIGVLDIRHGSGVYVGRNPDMLLVSNPVYGGVASKKLMLDLLAARLTIEIETAALAAERATGEQIETMECLLEDAGRNLEDDELLSRTNMAFHREIARSSGNAVYAQLLEVLTTLFQVEQRIILDVHGSRERDHAEHGEILDAIRDRDPRGARDRMTAHLTSVREKLIQWDPEQAPERASTRVVSRPS